MGYGVGDTGVDFVYISVRDAYLLMKNSKAVFVDARDEPDFKLSRLQTSFHLAANDIFFKQNDLDNSVIHHLIQLANSGKTTIVCLSDNCITGAMNRGHVSRCRHIAQYLVELGADRKRIVRMAGGLNEWKKEGLDGILGDLRPMYNGEILDWSKYSSQPVEGLEPTGAGPMCCKDVVAEMLALTEPKPSAASEVRDEQLPCLEGAALVQELSQLPLELKTDATVRLHSLKGAAELNGKTGTCTDFNEGTGRWTVTLEDGESKNVKPDNLEVLRALPAALKEVSAPAGPRPRVEVVVGGDVQDGDEGTFEKCSLPVCRPIPLREDTPTAYRVLKGELYRKPTKDSDKIIKLERAISSIVCTTGHVYQGAQGGRWAELDMHAGEKKGWVYIEGPGFGATTRKISSEYLQA